MNRLVRQTAVIARRDFIATVATPTFLLFLLAPFLMLGFGLVGGMGASQLTTNAIGRAELVAIASGDDAVRLVRADADLRRTYPPASAPAALRIVAPGADPAAQARALIGDRERDVFAVIYGRLERPNILREASSQRSAPYLAELAERAVRDRLARLGGDARLSTPTVEAFERTAPSEGARQSIGFAAVFIIFFLTLLLAGQAVGMLAEEKSNKVIEILAAAVPLETVFLGKLIGMFGVALLFVGFWGVLASQGLRFAAEDAPTLASLDPAIGLPAFIFVGALYFTMAYLLLGAVFLGLGAQASTVREIQMLSLPITIFQVAMFGLSSAAASSPGTPLALFAEIFPFSSPFAMAARGATDPRLWPHLLALVWQLAWVTLVIFAAARLFRRGVLKSGPPKGRRFWRREGNGVPATAKEAAIDSAR